MYGFFLSIRCENPYISVEPCVLREHRYDELFPGTRKKTCARSIFLISNENGGTREKRIKRKNFKEEIDRRKYSEYILEGEKLNRGRRAPKSKRV